MSNNALNMTRLAMIIGKMHETATGELHQLEDIFLHRRLGGSSDFEIAWQICELEHSFSRSANMVNAVLKICDLPEREVQPFAPIPGYSCEEQIEAWLDHLRSRCDELDGFYQELRKEALAAEPDSLDQELFSADLEEFLREQS